MGNSSRERKLRFMRDFGERALSKAVMDAFIRNGPGWLTDEQLDEIVNRQVSDWRFSQRIKLRNRARRQLEQVL